MSSSDRTECQAGMGLWQTLTNHPDGRKSFSFDNQNKDMMFLITLEFQGAEGIEITAADKSKVESNVEGKPDKYRLTLYPFENSDFLIGKWKMQRRGLNGKAPDQAWKEAQAKQLGVGVEQEIADLKQAVAAAGGDPNDIEAVAKICEQKKKKFIDLSFPPTAQSLARPNDPPIALAPWMRPSVYCGEKEPCLYVGAIEPEDIDQGQLGDCYFMCALACLSEFPELVKAAYRLPQSEDLGLYRARLCKDGWWNPVVVDDFLPVNPGSKLPLFAKNREEPEELWVSILEKAYAKLNGSYACIKAGDPAFAVADMVGGPYSRIYPQQGDEEEKNALFDKLLAADEADHIMCLGTPGVDTTMNSGTGGETADLAKKYDAVGLCTGHAFSLIRVKRTSEGHRLVMIRNPWGNDKEWNGDWSDESPLWTDKIKEEVGFYKADDGTFWMAWADVCKWFTAGSITYVLKESDGWSQARFKGRFNKGIPSSLLKMEVAGAGETELWCGVHQPDTRGAAKGTDDAKFLGILFSILKKNESTGKLERFWSPKNPEAFQTTRDQCGNPSGLTAGTYYILAQGYQEFDRNYAISLYTQSDNRITLTQMALTEQKKFNPSSKFTEAACEPAKNGDVLYQIATPRHDVVIWGKGISPVLDWNLPPTAAQKEELSTRAAREAAREAKLTGGLGAGALSQKQEQRARGLSHTKQSMRQAALPPSSPPPEPSSPTNTTGGGTAAAPPAATGSSSSEEVACVCEGWLQKYTTGRNTKGIKAFMPASFNWKRRYFRLFSDGRLSYSEDLKLGTPVLNTIALGKGSSALLPKPTKKHHGEVNEKKSGYLALAVQEGETRESAFLLLLQAEDDAAHRDWCKAFGNFCNIKE